MAFQVDDLVKIKKPKTKPTGHILTQETINVLTACNFTGRVSKLADDLIYVGFIDGQNNWVTQVFKEDELEVAE